LYGVPEDLRIVTTNLELLFEQAAKALFNPEPKVFQGPALPLGSRFRGIVHLHGSVDEPEDMVLTHRDFGRAYLTEADGWARRFLVELFSNYTVLFVGYSHNDTIMTYLTPSLPPDAEQRRFSLIGDQSDDLDHWARMGIEPIVFHQSGQHDFTRLDQAIAGLANLMRRGILAWRTEITGVAGGRPPIDDETAGIIDYALIAPDRAQFFVEAAESPEWIDWLDRRNHLAALFGDGELDEQSMMLSNWLVARFATEHAEELFSLIARHGGRLNPHVWHMLVRCLGNIEDATLSTNTLSRWVHFLMGSVPLHVDVYSLSGLIMSCSKLEARQELLQVYDAMTASRHQVRPSIGGNTSLNDHLIKGMLWENHLEPHLSEIAHSLLDRTTIRLQERHSMLVAWGEGGYAWDADNWFRSAIEPHSQDDRPHEIDALVDVARGCLEWLAANDPVATEGWCDRFAASDAPLLRRLVIHAMSARTDLSADEKVAWLLDRYDVNEVAARHEIFGAVAAAYPNADAQQRTALIEAVLEYRAPASDQPDYDPEIATAHYRHSWFHWLHEADPGCSIAEQALHGILAEHPDFVPRKHANFNLWSEIVPSKSPWTVQELLAQPATDVLPDLLTYQPTNRERFDGQDRLTLLNVVSEAVRSNAHWGLDLADAMVELRSWDSDLWQHVITAWGTAELDRDAVRRALSCLSTVELHKPNARDIASVLGELVKKADGAAALELLFEASSIASALRQYAGEARVPDIRASVGGVPQYVSWLSRANNHLSGKLALFWIFSIERWRNQQEIPPQSLNAEYENALETIVSENGIVGKFGRTVLASQFHFFLATDEKWALGNLLPLFDIEHEDFQCAWDGFLTWGQLSPTIAEHLADKFIRACQRLELDLHGDIQTRFVEYYIAAMGWLATGANDRWITEYLKYADAELKHLFAVRVGHRLRDLDETRQQEWWNIWLKDYWGNRLQGVPSSLDDAEIAEMLAWARHLPEVFSEAVDMATRMRPVPLNRSFILHNIGESGLVERYPNELAQFLVHLGQCQTEPWFWMGVKEIVERLLAQDLSADVDRGLQELIATRRLG